MPSHYCNEDIEELHRIRTKPIAVRVLVEILLGGMHCFPAEIGIRTYLRQSFTLYYCAQ